MMKMNRANPFNLKSHDAIIRQLYLHLIESSSILLSAAITCFRDEEIIFKKKITDESENVGKFSGCRH